MTAGNSGFRQEMIRVALFRGVESVRLDGNGILATDEKGEPLRLSFPLEIAKTRGGISVNETVLRGLKVSAPVFVNVNGKGYRGVIEISAADKGLQVINELPLEDYLVGLINCEISSQWPMEAIKAQAVIARSYAIFQRDARKNAPYHLESTVMDQVYEGCDIEDSRAARGVKETAGEVLTFGGSTIQAFYHSNCGGHTEASENVWGYKLPYLPGVACRYCQNVNSYRWEQRIPLRKVETQLKAAGINISGLRDIRPGSRNKSGRVSELSLFGTRGKVTVSGVALRKALGYSIIKSTNFELRIDDGDVLFSGSGNGHGVGLCQWGAKQRAADGFDYREILSYYYPGTRLTALAVD
nr:SpoIID/LytB domain-containing protein [Geobacter sp. OR-1]